MRDAKQKYFEEGLRLFNDEKFHESHEAIEKIWLKEKGDDRLFYQGLIVVAGGFYHVKKGRLGPAQKALEKALAKLLNYPDSYHGIRLERLRVEIQAWIESLKNVSGSPLLFPKIYSSSP